MKISNGAFPNPLKRKGHWVRDSLWNGKYAKWWSNILLIGALCGGAGWAEAAESSIKPLVRTLDLNLGDSTNVNLHDANEARVKLVAVESRKDPIRSAVRESIVTIEVNGERAELICSTYNLPVNVGGVQVDCPITRDYLDNSRGNAWALEADARLRLWPAESPWIRPGSFVYPVNQKWFASATQMANEPTYVDGGETPNGNDVYYHYGLDFGGAEDRVDVLAATDGLIVSLGGDILDGHEDSPARARYDVMYLLDDRGWYYRYSHLKLFETDLELGERVRMGQKLGELGKEGGSGGWSHLHFHILAKQPSGDYGIQAGYPFIWQAYVKQYNPEIIAVARPHYVIHAGETVTLDAGKSWAADGEITAYEWTFGDGSRATGRKTRRTYSQPGRYSAVLKVSNAAGHIDYDFAVVEVHSKEHPDRLPPTIHAAFSPTFGIQPGDPVTFKVRTFRTTDGEETWRFGDGTPPVQVQSDGNVDMHAEDGYAETVHRFREAGDYIVSVERSDRHGQTAVDRLHVRVGGGDHGEAETP